MPKTKLSVLEYAKREGKTLDWIYKQCRLGKLPATLRNGRWTISAPQESRSQKDEVAPRMTQDDRCNKPHAAVQP
jgi:hypothetical protein